MAKSYIKNLEGLPVKYHEEVEDVKHSYWMFTILVKSESERVALRNYLKENGIETRPTFHPVHTMPMYNSGERFEVAEDLGIRGINLPSYPDLSDSDIKYITDRITEFYDKH